MAHLKQVLFWLWFAIRLPAFLVLYWLRGPIVLVCNLIFGPFLVAWLFAWYAFPDKPHMVWGFATISFVAFVAAWVYDFILMFLSPQDMMQNL